LIAQLLPGVREFRVPLVSGYLWVVFAWILIGMPVPSKGEKTGLIGIINAASEYLSPAASVGVLTFVAYVLGILLTVDSKMVTSVLAWWWDKMLHKAAVNAAENNGSLKSNVERAKRELRSARPFMPSLSTETQQSISHITNVAIKAAINRPIDISQLRREFSVAPHAWEGKDNSLQETRVEAEERKTRVRRETLRRIQPQLHSSIIREIPLLAIKLQKDHKELFETYDRERSEADFRISISVPLLAIAIQIMALLLGRGDTSGAALVLVGGVLITIILLKRGWRKLRDSTANIVALLRVGAVTSDALDRLAGVPDQRAKLPSVKVG
jgi:hypothetical protein